jgi:molybdate transport system substrate-binding protein
MRRKSPSRAFFLAAILTAAVLSSPALSAQEPVRILVSAAASLQDALNEIIPLYEKSHPTVRVTLNLAGSGTLETQIEQGAPTDIFISAAPQFMDPLESKGLLLAGSRINLLENRIVLVVPKGTTNISNFRDLTHADVHLVAMGDPASVPAGMYARKILDSLGIYEAVRRKAVLGADVRQVLGYVESGSADAGIVYATDATISDRVSVVAEAPADSTAPIVYPAAVIRTSAHPDSAKDFMQFLRSDEARSVFHRRGFRFPAP